MNDFFKHSKYYLQVFVLFSFLQESCVVALDMYNYEQSKDFQYADSLVKMKETWKSNN